MTTYPDDAAFGFSETRYDDDGRPIGSLARRGLTKREYFAALAMQGLEASNFHSAHQQTLTSDVIAAMAVNRADALIAALNEEAQADG